MRGASSRRWGIQLTLVGLSASMLLLGPGSPDSRPASPAHASAERAAAEALLRERRQGRIESDGQRFDLVEGVQSIGGPGLATRVRIPSVGIDADVRPVGFVFREGRLQYDIPVVEAGQYAGSAPPGSPGNTVIGGHVALRDGTGIFRTLPSVTVGATIEVMNGDTAYRYLVTEVRIVAPDATEVMEPTQDATLTLITCSTDSARSKRVVVVGKLV